MLDTERTRQGQAETSGQSFSLPGGWQELVRAGRSAGERILVVPDEGADPPRTLAVMLAQAALDTAASPMTTTVVRVMGRLCERLLGSMGGHARLRELLDRAADEFPTALDASPAAAAEACNEATRLRDRLPAAAEAVLLDGRGTLLIAMRLLRRHRRAPRARMLEEFRGLAESLGARLRADDALSPGAASAERVAARLGTASQLLDASALSRVLPAQRGSRPLEPEHRARLERVASQLAEALRTIPAEPEVVVVAPAAGSAAMTGADRLHRVASPLAAAPKIFDDLAAERVVCLRAARVARIETDSSGWSDAGRQAALAAVEALDWQGLEPDELALLPSVLALEFGGRVRGEQLGSLSHMLRSGRPIAGLVVETLDDLHRDESWDAIAGFHPGLGYLAVAHREAMVLQSSSVCPDHLAQGLEACARSLAPAIALVTVPREGAEDGDRPALSAALAGRATPLLRYDPAAGETWAERFDLEGNPDPGAVWPLVGSDPGEPWTFVHFAASDPALQRHVFAEAVPSDDPRLMPVVDWLAANDERRWQQIPFLQVVDAAGQPSRAIVARPAAIAALDRLRAWRILQELAGFHNEHARRAAERARAEAEERAAAERAALESAHAKAIERVRLESATETVDRIVAALLGQVPALPIPPPAIASPPAPTPSGADVIDEAGRKGDGEQDVLAEDPWIDSGLCTSCNECTNLNGRMFRYNANKQAELVDRSAGTFEQVVKAAEKCTARCIHVGTPPENDPTVTDALRARAAKFR